MPRLVALALLALGALAGGCATTQAPAPVTDTGSVTPRPPVKALAKPPAAKVVAPAPGEYVIKPGDTLYKIAFQNGLDHRQLAAWNALLDPDRILAGETLRLTPPPNKVAVTASPPAGAARDSAHPVSKAPSALPAPDLSDKGGADSPAVQWSWPANGRMLASFDEAAGRKGIDIGGVRGMPIVAAAPGQVVYAGAGLRGYGKLIIIKHSNNILTAYGHIDTILVKEGQAVVRDQLVGEMGDTDAEQVKLHFEIRVHGKPVDPMEFLPSRG